jgi:hypothetical protein
MQIWDEQIRLGCANLCYSIIQKKKVVLFEELASEFGLKVPDTIERITTLVQEGRLTGHNIDNLYSNFGYLVR